MASKPKLMLVRGLMRGNAHWGSFPDVLRKSRPDIDIELVEIAGNGAECARRTPIGPLGAIEDIQARSRLCREGEPFHLCGISLGGMIALKWAEKFPRQLMSVTAINASLAQFSPFFRRLEPQNYVRLMTLLGQTDVRAREKGILQITSNRPRFIEENLEAFTRFGTEHPASRANFFRQLILASRVRIDEKPVVPLKIISSRMDRLVHPSCSEMLAAAFGVRGHVHPTAGHDLPLDEPQWLSDVLVDGMN